MQAVIRTGGKQYLVKPGDKIDVELLGNIENDEVKFEDVLMISDGENDIKVGTPTIKGATVSGRLLGEKKGKKVIIFKYKRRKGYRNKKGHRQKFTSVEITDIQA